MKREKRFGRRLIALFLASIVGVSMFALPASAVDLVDYHGIKIRAGTYSENGLESGVAKENGEKIWKKLRALGFSEKAAAGAMGNFMMESGLDPTSESPNACGLAQWTDVDGVCSNKTNFLNWAEKKGKNWKEIDTQCEYLWDSNAGLIYGNVYESARTCYSWSHGELTVSADVVWKGLKDPKSITDVHAFAKAEFATPAQAAECWLWFHERPAVCVSHAAERMKYANAIYEKFTGTKVDSESSKNGDTVDASAIATGGYLPEENYVNLDKLTEDGIALPTKAELSATQGGKYDLKVLDEWKEDVAFRHKNDTHGGIRTAVALLGILLTLYSVLVYIAYQFDVINNIIDVSLLSIITFGRLRISPEFDKSTFMNHPEGGAKGTSKTGQKTVVHKDILIICTIGITIGVLIFSGKLYMMISWVIGWVKGVIFK